jgi:hypothetical protein
MLELVLVQSHLHLFVKPGRVFKLDFTWTIMHLLFVFLEELLVFLQCFLLYNLPKAGLWDLVLSFV